MIFPYYKYSVILIENTRLLRVLINTAVILIDGKADREHTQWKLFS